MKNTIKDRILSERITGLSQLSAAEQAVAKGDSQLMELIRENQALAGRQRGISDAPPRTAMLRAAMQAAGESTEEHRMTIFQRMFAGRSPLAQAGLAALLVAVFSFAYMGVMTVSSTPAWSMTSGNVLEYRLGDVGGEDAVHALLDSYIDKIREVKAGFYGDAVPDQKNVQISVNVEAECEGPGEQEFLSTSVVISLLEDNPELLEAIKAGLAEIPGTPEPIVQSAIWFYGPEGPGQGGMRFKVEDQVFNFPDTATEEEIESTIREWLAENRPEKEFVVDINIERETDAEGREKVRVESRIHEVGAEEDAVSVSAETPAHAPSER